MGGRSDPPDSGPPPGERWEPFGDGDGVPDSDRHTDTRRGNPRDMEVQGNHILSLSTQKVTAVHPRIVLSPEHRPHRREPREPPHIPTPRRRLPIWNQEQSGRRDSYHWNGRRDTRSWGNRDLVT